jgi:hypothetical protein
MISDANSLRLNDPQAGRNALDGERPDRSI